MASSEVQLMKASRCLCKVDKISDDQPGLRRQTHLPNLVKESGEKHMGSTGPALCCFLDQSIVEWIVVAVNEDNDEWNSFLDMINRMHSCKV